MSRSFTSFRWLLAPAVVVCSLVASAPHAEAQVNNDSQSGSSRLIEFDHPGHDAANIEVNITASMIGDFFGLGDAAVEGVVQAVLQSDLKSAETEFAEEQLAAVREIVGGLQGTIDQVRVRVYTDHRTAPAASAVGRHYGEKLAADGWDKVVYTNSGDDSVNVFLNRREGALRGVFVVAGDKNELIVVNAACDISPARLRQATERITKVWLKFGGKRDLQRALEQLHRELHLDAGRHGRAAPLAARSPRTAR